MGDMSSAPEAADEGRLVAEEREEHEGQTRYDTRTKGIGQSPATPVHLPVKTMETGYIPPLQLSSTPSPDQTKAVASSTAAPDDADDPVHTPMPGVWPAGHEVGTDGGGNDMLLGAQHAQPSYFGPETTLRAPSEDGAKLASTSTSTSNASSPLRSGHASSSSFQSSQAGYGSFAELNRIDSSYLQDIASTTVPNSHTTSPIAEEDFALTDPPPPKQTAAAHLRKDGPHYPDQSFAALQSQYYPPLYHPHPLRTRSSNPSQGSLYSFTSSTHSRDRAAMVSGTRTAGNTPAQSPGLFVSAARYGNTGDDGREEEYGTSMLHPSHLQAPKETHKLVKDLDPISGRKTVNNYEFQAKLGSGTHGTVKLGRNLESSELVAIKIVRRFSKKLRLGKNESPEDKVKKEVAILKKARHPHVVSLLEVIDDPEFGKVYLILEYVELGEIIWRSVAEPNLARFEMERVMNEKLGHYDEGKDDKDIEQFNIDQRARHDESVLTKQGQFWSRDKQSKFWSLEHGNVAEDDQVNPQMSSIVPKTPVDADIMPQSKHTEASTSGVALGSSSSSLTHSSGNIWDDPDLESDHEGALPEQYIYVACLTMSQTRDAFRDTVLGLEYLHYQGIIHRDIKPANLLWTKDHRVKISDFGVSYLGRPIREDDNNEEIEEADSANLDEAIELAKTVGTPAFYAPELCDSDLFDQEKTPERPQITGQIDVWALGVTLYAMTFGRLPFFDDNAYKMFELIAKEEVFIPQRRLKGVSTADDTTQSKGKRPYDVAEYEEVDEELRDLLKRLLHKQPSKRITLREVKHHPWVLRGIKNPKQWIDDTDPSLQSHGKKIEVSTQEVDEAVAPLTIFERLKVGVRRLGSVVRGRDSRKRAESNAKTGEASIGDRQGRRTSLRGDEQIIPALRASRDSGDHPLSQSLAATPEISDASSYFPDAALEINRASPKARRPRPAERAISTAESTKTIRPNVPTTTVRPSTPPPLMVETASAVAASDSAPSSSSSLSGIFGGAGRRFVRGMRSRDRAADRESTSQSSRSSSVEKMGSNYGDPHATPTIAFSTAMAAGHVDQPPALRDHPVRSQAGYTPLQSPVLPREPADAFARAQEQNYRRHIIEVEESGRMATETRQRRRANTAVQCPPSPDDQLAFYDPPRRKSEQSQDGQMVISSSDDYMTSGISESFSHPSIPSVVSGASSLGTTGEEQVESSIMSTGLTITAANMAKLHDEDDAGYNGDGDGAEEEEESDDDGGIMFGKK